jgi:hypothetical protein
MKTVLCTLIALFCTTPLYAHGISDADKQAMLDGGYLKYAELGASHMLSGYDHLLFLFGVIFFLTQFKDIVKFVTAFTLGHSVTLILATFLEISANYYLVDAVIALTVIYKGFDNIDGFKKYLGTASPDLIKLVFVFGLIHGFGLSTRLQQLPLGDDGLLLRIISFNVGVEIGQILALTVILFLLVAWRKTESYKKFSVASNIGLMILGMLLFLMQMHGYSHEVFVDELAFNKEAHQMEHFDFEGSIRDRQKTKGPWKDTITLEIAAGKSTEYKFHVLKNASLDYSWRTTGGPLFFDFHGERKGSKDGSFKSFEKSTKNEAKGSFKAPFEGTHGWYWKNKGLKTVKVTLKTNGSYKILGIR